MGQQQSSKQPASLSSGQMLQSGYRVTYLSPQYTPLSPSNKLNLMTDYVIDKDPRLINLKELYQNGQKQVQFRVFNVLECIIRVVKVEIKKINNQKEQQNNNNKHQTNNNKLQTQTCANQNQQKQQIDIYTALTKKPYTFGIKFKYYPKINDTILRVSKVFKNSPLQKVGIKKDQYIVGIVEGDFMSIKQFVQLVKVLIQAQVESITLGICNLSGETRLEKLKVQELIKWKQQYGVGYLGVQLAEGWLNRLELRKSINLSRKRVNTNKQIITVQHDNIGNNVEIMRNADKSIFQTYAQQNSIIKQESTIIQQKQALNDKAEQLPQGKQKQQVDFFKNSQKIIHDDEHQNQSQKNTRVESQQNKLQKKQTNIVQNQKLFQLDQTSKTSLQDVPMIGLQQPQQQKVVQKVQSHSLPTLSKPPRLSQPLPPISASFAEEQSPSSTSQVSSQQIQQKCLQLSQLRQKDTNVIKKTQNILQINFKGILKNQNIDDASTICLCKDYSKHCEKCFKQKDQNYYFFNKKTNKIYTIQKAMMFPKKS